MSKGGAGFWTDKTSVLFTGFWGWSPETWGTIGWTGQRGLTRRTNILSQLTDPFITVCYVTSNKTYIDPELKGQIAGFYLVSHETGGRNEFTHPNHHANEPEKWEHSLRSIRAFSYLPEYRLSVSDFDPTMVSRARSISTWGEILADPEQIKILKETPWVEVDVYTSSKQISGIEDAFPEHGKVRAGPANKGGYLVPPVTQLLPRQLYVLRLDGDTDAFLGKPADNRAIYKIGLSASPDMRRQAFQKSMPRGAFQWRVERTSIQPGFDGYSFEAAVAGEDEMKKYLAECGEWLGGEFYLANGIEIEKAWQKGNLTAKENMK